MLALLVGIAVTVDGESTCPTPARVAERLSVLLADIAARDAPDHARLVERGDVIEVALDNSSGRPLARREFSRQPSCDELASAIAVVIATWEAGLSGDSPEIEIDLRDAPGVAAHPAFAGLALAATPAQRLPSSSMTTLAVGGGAITIRDRAGWVGGGTAELSVASSRTRWSGRLGVLVTTSKREALAPGDIEWARHGLVLGTRYAVLSAASFMVEVTGDGTLGMLVSEGRGFTVNRRSYSFDPGVATGVRGSYLHGEWALALEANETVWLREGHLEVTGLRPIDLPGHEVHLNVVLTWRFAKL